MRLTLAIALLALTLAATIPPRQIVAAPSAQVVATATPAPPTPTPDAAAEGVAQIAADVSNLRQIVSFFSLVSVGLLVLIFLRYRV